MALKWPRRGRDQGSDRREERVDRSRDTSEVVAWQEYRGGFKSAELGHMSRQNDYSDMPRRMSPDERLRAAYQKPKATSWDEWHMGGEEDERQEDRDERRERRTRSGRDQTDRESGRRSGYDQRREERIDRQREQDDEEEKD